MKQLHHLPNNQSIPKNPQLSAWNSQDAPEMDSQNVYLEGRREWNERYGDYISREHAWKKGFFLMAIIALICAGTVAYTSTQSRLVPYVVEVDKLGSPVAVQRADLASRADSRIIRSQLARWIENIRSVYQDAGAERINIQYAYAMIRRSDPAFNKLNEYLEKHDPFERAKSEGASTEINSVLPISDNTWQVQWTENVHTTKGTLESSLIYQANLTVALDPPTEEAALLKNPMGVYITNFNWSQRL